MDSRSVNNFKSDADGRLVKFKLAPRTLVLNQWRILGLLWLPPPPTPPLRPPRNQGSFQPKPPLCSFSAQTKHLATDALQIIRCAPREGSWRFRRIGTRWFVYFVTGWSPNGLPGREVTLQEPSENSASRIGLRLRGPRYSGSPAVRPSPRGSWAPWASVPGAPGRFHPPFPTEAPGPESTATGRRKEYPTRQQEKIGDGRKSANDGALLLRTRPATHWGVQHAAADATPDGHRKVREHARGGRETRSREGCCSNGRHGGAFVIHQRQQRQLLDACLWSSARVPVVVLSEQTSDSKACSPQMLHVQVQIQ